MFTQTYIAYPITQKRMEVRKERIAATVKVIAFISGRKDGYGVNKGYDQFSSVNLAKNKPATASSHEDAKLYPVSVKNHIKFRNHPMQPA